MATTGSSTTTGDWQRLAKAKRQSLKDAIPAHWRIEQPSTKPTKVSGAFIQQYLSHREVEITETDAAELSRKLSSGAWSATEVTTAFCHRAAVAHQLLPCLHEIFFDRAIERAAELDEYFAEHGKPTGLLHGLPVSLKDQINISGIDTTTGVVAFIGNGPRNSDAEIVRELLALGAVPFVKTSTPQFSFALESDNNIIGYTYNPVNTNLSAGGSSGGEASLVAMKGSPVGFGSDIGGSVRVPAAFTGLYGLKPTTTRLPYFGITRCGDGQAGGTPFSLGPMSPTADSLALMMKAVLSQEPWLHDPDVARLPWDEQVYKQALNAAKGGDRLVFGAFRSDGRVNPQPPVQRALDIVFRAVRDLGHEIIDWAPPDHNEASELAYATFAFDGGQEIHEGLAKTGEPVVSCIASVVGEKSTEQANARATMQTNVAIKQYRKQYMDYWNSTAKHTSTQRPVDAIIAPISPYAAPEPGKYRWFGYSPWVNLLDYTGCVIPVTHVDQTRDVYSSNQYQALGEIDRLTHDEYDSATSHGAPVALQIVGMKLEEEKVLAIAKVLGEACAAAKNTNMDRPNL